MNPDAYDTLVVGAGYAGSILAERLASQCGHRVLVIDRRDHIAGNAFDYFDEHGVMCHKYGPHIFHTQSEKVVDYLSAFTDWRPYEHRVLANVDGQQLPMPINIDTVNRLYGLELDSEEDMESFLAERAEPRERIETSEDSCVARFGQDLYEKFFRGYTRKQWALDPSELHASVCARIPIRFNRDDRYFNDTFQKMPLEGYTAMFTRMLDHPNIEVRTGTDFKDIRSEVEYSRLVYTGPIDEFYDHRFGKLPYRSLAFEHRTIQTPDNGLEQPVATINEPSGDVPFTRTTEYRWLTGQRHTASTLAVEYPRSEGDPYYPVPQAENRELYKRYESLGEQEDPNVTFVGRLARYQYLNMDQVTAQALSTFEKLVAGGHVTPLPPVPAA
jgi:UDP-galactopyranose mutase